MKADVEVDAAAIAEAEAQLVDEAVAEAAAAEDAVTASGPVLEGPVAVFNRKYGFTSAEATAEASPEVQTSEVPDGDQADN